MQTRPTRHAPALAAALAGALAPAALAAPRAWTLLVVDSLGQPLDNAAVAAWRQTRHRASKAAFRWIRMGHRPPAPILPEGAEPPDQRPPPVEPEWDGDGQLLHGLGVTVAGLPRILLIDPQGRVVRREAWLATHRLRYLVRHPQRAAAEAPRAARGAAGGS